MNNTFNIKTVYIGLVTMLLIAITGCQSDDYIIAEPVVENTEVNAPDVNFSAGSADFSNFVAVGNSLTAGYSDGTLFAKGQAVSFPNILAQQFALVGGGEFTQPLINDDIGGLLIGGNVFGSPRLIFDLVNRVPVSVGGTPTTEVTSVIPGPYNNMGVPGAKSFHLLSPSYGDFSGLLTSPKTANPYFVRMASDPGKSVLEDAMAMSPTFFSLWIGNNDVLGYATTGGDDSDPITDQETFNFALSTLAETLVSGGANGIISNIPSVTDAPFFTTVPHAPLDPTDPDFGPLIPTLNGVFEQLNQVFAFLESQGIPQATDRSIIFSETAASAVVIKDETLADLSAQITGVLNGSPTFPLFVQSFGLPAEAAPLVANLFGAIYGQARQANESDLLVLQSQFVIGKVNTDVYTFLLSQGLPPDLAGQFAVDGVTNPLEDKWVLIPSEIDNIVTATNNFNQVINDLATQHDLALFDVNTFFNGVATNGFQAGSAFMTADYVTGGTFSLDGVHPSPRGNAVVANQMIDLINSKYESTIPNVNPVDYTGLYID